MPRAIATDSPRTVSTAEAAYVTGLSPKVLNQAIDRGEVAAQRLRRRQVERRLGEPELVYLVLRRRVGPVLSKRFRSDLYRQLRSCYRSADHERILRLPAKLALADGAVEVSVHPAVEMVAERLEQLRKAEFLVASDREIRGGDPVVVGTRVPAYLIAELHRQGATHEELLEDYPSLTREHIDAAIVFAETHPRRGRPRRAPWRTAS